MSMSAHKHAFLKLWTNHFFASDLPTSTRRSPTTTVTPSTTTLSRCSWWPDLMEADFRATPFKEMKSVSRPELHNSFLNFANIATDRQHHRSCEPPMLTRPGRLQDVIETQMSGKLSVSAPTYTQWSFPSTLQKQQQQILIPKLEEYALTSYMPRPQGPML